MRQFLSNNRLLIAAWVFVLAALGGGLGYLLLNPVPPSTVVDTVTLAVPAPPPPPTPRFETLPELASELTPEERDDPADSAAEVPAPAGQTETADAATPDSSTPESESTGNEATASPGAAAPATEDAQPAQETPATPAEETIAVPLPKPEPPKPQEESEIAAEAAPSAPVAPQPETEPAPESAADTENDEQAVNVPLIPPAPEELPYWERYRQPFNNEDERPRVAVVLSGLGLSDAATQAAINNLPAAITLSFSPYARGLERWIALARARGHEVMLDLPMEPTSFPNEDPGPQALLTSLSAEDNLDRLDWVLSRGSAYVGVAGNMGSRFTASLQQMEPILKELKSRGLIFLDNRTTEKSVVPALAVEVGLQSAFNNRAIDERQASRVAIDARLAQIERIALSEGFAVAMAQPYPVTLDRLAEWATELTARGIVIAPISALVGKQKQR